MDTKMKIDLRKIYRFDAVERNADGSLPNNNLFRLSSGSNMINKGVNVGLPYLGSAPDLGAFERE